MYVEHNLPEMEKLFCMEAILPYVGSLEAHIRQKNKITE